MIRNWWVSALILLCLGGCSSSNPDVVFEGVDFEQASCPDGAADTAECLRVTAPVIGSGRGTGNCLVYASGNGRNLLVAADSGELELVPGDTFEWEVVVEPPDDPEFDGWNPRCSPVAEG